MKKFNINTHIMKKIFIIVLGLGIGVFFFIRYPILKKIIGLIVISFIISYTMRPLQRVLTDKGINRKISSAIVIFTIITFIFMIIGLLIPWIYMEGEKFLEIVSKVQSYYEDTMEGLLAVSEDSFIKELVINFTEKLQMFFVTTIENLVEKIINISDDIFMIFTVPVLVYFFLSDGDGISKGIMKYMPFKNRFSVKRMVQHIDKVMERYIITQFELCGIIGLLTFISLLLCGIKYAFILSMLNAIFNIIPYFGPIIGAVPILFISLVASPQKAIIVSVVLFIIQQVEGDVISPKIVGETVDSHPITILLLLIVGGNIGGIPGMIMAVPIWVMGKIAIGELEHYLF